MQDHLAELEVRMAFQEKAIQELSDVIARQQREIDRLVRELETLKLQVRALAPSPVVGRDEETPPPHY